MQTVILNLPLGKLTGTAVVWRSYSDCRSPEHTFCLDRFSISSGQHTSPNWWNLIGKKILNFKKCQQWLGCIYLVAIDTGISDDTGLTSICTWYFLALLYLCTVHYLPLMLPQAWLTGSMKWRQNRSTSGQLSTGTVVTQWSASSILSTLWAYKKQIFTFYESIIIKTNLIYMWLLIISKKRTYFLLGGNKWLRWQLPIKENFKK